MVSVAGPHDGVALHACSVWHPERGGQGPPSGPLESFQRHGHGEGARPDDHIAVHAGVPIDSAVSEPWITHPNPPIWTPSGQLGKCPFGERQRWRGSPAKRASQDWTPRRTLCRGSWDQSRAGIASTGCPWWTVGPGQAGEACPGVQSPLGGGQMDTKQAPTTWTGTQALNPSVYSFTS